VADKLVSAEPANTSQAEPQVSPDKVVRCRACGHSLTQRSKAIVINGSHEHTFRNPAGYSFHVMCFSDASGGQRAGEATSAASWFAGFDWCFALCGKCQTHVGWWYLGRDGSEESFAGLIATRLA
jgi:hypothetical protein